MNTRHSPLARPAALALAFSLLLLSACAPRSSETPSTSTPPPAKSTEPAHAGRPEKLVGPVFTLIDQRERPLECVILAKQGSQVLVKRASDQTRYVIDFDRLSTGSQRLLARYPDENTQELRTFVDARDYAEAKRKVHVEMISATWCGVCAEAKNFFATEGITYAAYDHESHSGKQRKKDWKSDTIPTVKIGDHILSGFGKDAYIAALLDTYRKQLAAEPAP